MRPLACPTRRRLLQACACAPWTAAGLARAPADDEAAAAALLRQGGVVLMLRHARTTPGVGDPPGFRLQDCGTQRNLSDEGRAQARRLSAWLQTRALAPTHVYSSRWCRCLDTARLVFGRAEPWPPLDSMFDGSRDREPALQALRARLRERTPTGFEAWVTHQANITALTGVTVAMGEAVILAAGPEPGAVTIRGRLSFD